MCCAPFTTEMKWKPRRGVEGARKDTEDTKKRRIYLEEHNKGLGVTRRGVNKQHLHYTTAISRGNNLIGGTIFIYY